MYVGFWWAVDGGHTLLRTDVWEGGTLVYYAPGAVNTGVLLDQDKWYQFTYTYDGADTVNWSVVDTTTTTEVLNVNFASGRSNATTTHALEWNTGTYAQGSGYHALIDNVGVTPEPATMALLSIGGLVVLARRRRA